MAAPFLGAVTAVEPQSRLVHISEYAKKKPTRAEVYEVMGGPQTWDDALWDSAWPKSHIIAAKVKAEEKLNRYYREIISYK